MGVISAIGNNLNENRKSLFDSKSGIKAISHIETKHAETIKVGEVGFKNEELASILNIDSQHNFTRTALLGSIAAKEAVFNSGITNINKYNTGLVSATSVGGMDMTESYFKSFSSQPETQKYISSHHAGDSSQKIAKILGLTGFVTTISTACSSSANAIMMGARLIEAGKLDRVIVGGTDALSKFTINGFKSLMILCDDDCAPFDVNRRGLNLGEGAAYLVLESERVIKKENKRVLAYLTGYGNANDAFHQTASSENGEGAYLAMKEALKRATLAPVDIDYINAHGTATINNDLSESKALKRVFEEQIPVFSSTKSLTGHALAAAGAIEAVYSLLALEEGKIPANLNFHDPINETGLIPTKTVMEKNLRHVLSNSFGFGGNCSALIFSKS